MAIAEEFWRDVERVCGPLPDKGQKIRAHLRDGDVLTGTVALVWMAMDSPVINLNTRVGQIHVHIGLGDTWEPFAGPAA
jgi:hypothetical protein